MEGQICNIQVLLRAAEFLERREREAEHGYALVLPISSPDSDKRIKQKNKKISVGGNSNRSVHNELEKNRRAQLRHCLEELKKQVPLSSDSTRNTTLNLLRQAQLHIKKLQAQDERAEQLKGRLLWEQRELRIRLEQLQRGTERMRNNSHGSTMSSERSDSDREDVEVDVESIVFECDSDELSITHTGADHCYSSMDKTWL
ncbi:Max dimerization protein 3 [Oryzias melastigma]|uniref:Max dimerization protein 3 n=1 Tax=Oryzias melastigma TaxID=30732 RepID=A0A3B3BQ89_ORYME|nr:max dimerization protein 3 [Oryzias melastigma]KAF6731294.1 Max dimerization protein 3 [Oryzias melastigma]